MKHQPPDYDYHYGYTEIVKGQLFLGGEHDVDPLLYGETEARHLNRKGAFQNSPTPLIDTWLDLRDERPTNRWIYLPVEVEYVSIPFRDGVLEEASIALPRAKEILREHLQKNKRVLVTCHEGRSRSVLLLLWYLAEKEGSFFDAYWIIKGARPIIEPHPNFAPLIAEWKE